MSTYKRPGVYLNEVLLPQVDTPVPDDATPLSFPTLVAPANRGPVEPTFVGSWSEYARLYGYFDQTPVLAHAVYQYLQNGGGGCYVHRIEGATATEATRTLNDRSASAIATLQVDALNSGDWGNDIQVEVTDAGGRFNLIVYYGGNTSADVVETWLDLSMTDGDERYAISLINNPVSGSNFITATDLDSSSTGDDANPAVQSATVLAGGTDGSAPTTSAKQAVFAVDGSSPLDVITEPIDLYLPGESDAAVLNAAIAYVEDRDRAFIIIDTAKGTTPAAAVTFAAGLTVSSRAAVYYPHVWVADPSSKKPDALRLSGPGASVLGRYSMTDRNRGPWKPAAGLSTGIAGGVQLERKLTNKDLDDLNAGHVNAIRNIPGNGLRIMGARTLKKREADKYVSVRRTLSYIKEGLKDVTQFAVFEPNDPSLWNAVASACQGFLSDVQRQGGLVNANPAFYVKCDETNNTPASIDAGQVVVEVGVALLQPAEFVVITVSQTRGGGATTSEQ